MTSSLQLTSQQSSTKSIGNPRLTMMSNDDLNAFYQGLVDEDGGFLSNEDDCIDDDGAVDDDALEENIAHKEAAYERKRNLLLSLMQIVEHEEMEEAEADAVAFYSFREQFRCQHRKKRRKAKRQWYCDPITGKLRRVCPHLSSWWLDYVQNPEPDCPTWNKVFRQRFRLPYASYLQILEWVSGDNCDGLFDRWRTEADGFTGRRSKKKTSPIELLLLGTLRYLGRGWTFDDISEATKVSRDVHRCFFHAFTTFGAKFLYPRYVCMPHSTADLRNCESEYAVAGFPGCIGSTDATHIPLDKVTASFRQSHLGYKLGSDSTTRTYNLTVNHRRQILHTTTGHPGRWNDRTLVRFDTFMADLRDGAFDDVMDFTLQRKKNSNMTAAAADVSTAVSTATDVDESAVEDVKIKGAYVIVDNGYLAWPTTIPPVKDTCNRSELRFSQWLEALRKDVECTFGILKGRWRILKTGIRVHNTEASDNIWMTCCALHNFLLDVDGLSHKWEEGVPSSFETEAGEFADEDIPAAIRRLVDPTGIEGHRLRTFDSSQFGYQSRDDDDDIENGTNPRNTNQLPLIRSGTSVKSIEFNQFRAMLIDHFNIAFHENKLKWPTRFAKTTKPFPIIAGLLE